MLRKLRECFHIRNGNIESRIKHIKHSRAANRVLHVHVQMTVNFYTSFREKRWVNICFLIPPKSKHDSDPLNPRCEISCRRLHGTEVVIVSLTVPLGHRAAPRCMYTFHPHGALLVVTV
jgi:hypothetical protein